MLTDLEAVFRSLKAELDLRPIDHHKSARVGGHLFISVLAYRLVHSLRIRLKASGIAWAGRACATSSPARSGSPWRSTATTARSTLF